VTGVQTCALPIYYDLYTGLDNGEKRINLAYNLIINKEIIREGESEKEILSLDRNDKETGHIKGEIVETDLLNFLQTKDTVKWTDYIENFDKEVKKVAYELKLDDKQEIKDTKIKLDYYENTREGFVIKKEFSQ